MLQQYVTRSLKLHANNFQDLYFTWYGASAHFAKSTTAFLLRKGSAQGNIIKSAPNWNVIHNIHEIWGIHSSKDSNQGLLGYDAL